MAKPKELEARISVRGAESSFDLVIRRHLKLYRPYFSLIHYQTIGTAPYLDPNSTATHAVVIKVWVKGRSAIAAAEGEGPVNALDTALRKVLEEFYPTLKSVHLTDYKVRVLDSKEATASTVRVLIESTDETELVYDRSKQGYHSGELVRLNDSISINSSRTVSFLTVSVRRRSRCGYDDDTKILAKRRVKTTSVPAS